MVDAEVEHPAFRVMVGRGLCQPCTDSFWAEVGFRLRESPRHDDPRPETPICPQCAQGWFGRLLREDNPKPAPPSPPRTTKPPPQDDLSLLFGF
jgi:hypothetical protein